MQEKSTENNIYDLHFEICAVPTIEYDVDYSNGSDFVIMTLVDSIEN